MRSRLRLAFLAFSALLCLMTSTQALGMYDPGTGRFLQRDSTGYPDGMNSYGAYHVLRGGVDPSGNEVAGYYDINRGEWVSGASEGALNQWLAAREQFLAAERRKNGTYNRWNSWSTTLYQVRGGGWRQRGGATETVTCGCWFKATLERKINRTGLQWNWRQDWVIRFDKGSGANFYRADILNVTNPNTAMTRIYFSSWNGPNPTRVTGVRIVYENDLRTGGTAAANPDGTTANGAPVSGLWWHYNGSELESFGYNGYYENLYLSFDLEIECENTRTGEIEQGVLSINFREHRDARSHR